MGVSVIGGRTVPRIMDYEKVKIVVFVPEDHANTIRELVGSLGVGSMGDYTHCSFSSTGIGRFTPGQNTQPAIGTVGEPQQVQEERIEFLCPREKASEIVSMIKQNHPYEEVALDVYPLVDIS